MKRLAKISEGRPNAVDMIKNGQIQMVINTPGGMIPRRDENAIRAAAYAHNVCIMTTMTGAEAAVEGHRGAQAQAHRRETDPAVQGQRHGGVICEFRFANFDSR